jgi:DNA polymerase I-like protein with 3'-5' exonuclease and polymerase domains
LAIQICKTLLSQPQWLLLLQVAVILAKMEFIGVGIDPRHLLGHKAALKQRMAAITTRAQQLAGSAFNLASSSQLAKVLYGDLGLPAPTGTGRCWCCRRVVVKRA